MRGMVFIMGLQDQELMAQGKDSACRAARVRKQAGAEESRATKRVNMPLAGYTRRLCEFSRFNNNGLFSGDRAKIN